MDSYDPFILILSGQSDLRRMMEFAVMEPFNQRIAIRYHMLLATAKEVPKIAEWFPPNILSWFCSVI
jgi:type II secretory pathway predicted ATPase ExeA